MGIEIVSKTDEIIKRLKSEGKIEILNKPKHIKAILEMNDEMEKVRCGGIFYFIAPNGLAMTRNFA